MRGLTPPCGGVGLPPQDALDHSAKSVASRSAANSEVALHHALERRVDWLEEDLGVAQRRLRDTFGLSPGGGGDAGALMALAVRLEEELNQERAWRSSLEEQLVNVHDSLQSEKANREEALRHLGKDLRLTIQGFVDKIDGSLSNDKQVLTNRAIKTENALKALIARVESGLASGSRFIQETVGLTRCSPDSPDSSSIAACGALSEPDTTSTTASSSTHTSSSSVFNVFGMAARASGSAVVSADTSVQVSNRDCEGYVDISTTATSIVADGTLSAPFAKMLTSLQEENTRLRQNRSFLHEKRTELRIDEAAKCEENDQSLEDPVHRRMKNAGCLNPAVDGHGMPPRKSSISMPTMHQSTHHTTQTRQIGTSVSDETTFGKVNRLASGGAMHEPTLENARVETASAEKGTRTEASSAEALRPHGTHPTVYRFTPPSQNHMRLEASAASEILFRGGNMSPKAPQVQATGSCGMVNGVTQQQQQQHEQQQPHVLKGRQVGTNPACIAPVPSSSGGSVRYSAVPPARSTAPVLNSVKLRTPMQRPPQLSRHQQVVAEVFK